jgi:hypothetical protein
VMGWSLGYDSRWSRDVGYGVPAICDHPVCLEEIDRGLSYVCGGEPYGGDRGCGLYFCEKHLFWSAKLPQLCERCLKRRRPFAPKPDLLQWIYFKMTDPSWEEWRKENGLTPEAMEDRGDSYSLGFETGLGYAPKCDEEKPEG